MGRQWTEEQRQRQSELIQKWRPWEKSTGPKTLAGKNISCQNGWKNGLRVGVPRTMKQIKRSCLGSLMEEGELWHWFKEKHPEALAKLLADNPDMYARLAWKEADWEKNGYTKLM